MARAEGSGPVAVADPPAKETGKGRRASQKELPGVHDAVVKIPAVTKAARAYVEARDEFQEASTLVQERKGQLVELLKKHGLETYMTAGMSIQLTHGKDGVKVKVVSEGAEEED